MAASVRSSTKANGPAASSLTVDKPAGAAVGDVLFMWIAADGVAAAHVPFSVTGFTPVGLLDSGKSVRKSATTTLALWRRVVDGTEGATFTITWGTGTDFAAGSAVCVCVQGADTGTPEDVAVVGNDGGAAVSANVVAPSVSPPSANALLLSAFASDLSIAAASYTAPGTMAELQDIAVASRQPLMVASEALTASGATGTRTAVANVSQEWVGGSVAVRSAGVAATMAAPLGGLTSSATASTDHPAALAAPMGGVVAAATAAVEHAAVLSAPLGGLTSSATAAVAHDAVLNAPLGALTAQATATPETPPSTVDAVLIAPLGGLSALAVASTDHPAALSATLGSLTATASGTVTVHATANAPLGGLTAAATAVASTAAYLDAPLGGLTASATGAVGHPATLSAPLGGLAASATASVAITASAATAPLGGLAATATATVEHHATASAPLGGLGAELDATTARAAVLTAPLGGLVAHATGSAYVPRDVTVTGALLESAWAAELGDSPWSSSIRPPQWSAEVHA